MTTTVDNLIWRTPWRPLSHPLDLPALQQQLEREVADGHPLWGRKAEVVGRRVDTDDVLVRCSDEVFATVHLAWSRLPHSQSTEYPSTYLHRSLAELQQAIDADASDYYDED